MNLYSGIPWQNLRRAIFLRLHFNTVTLTIESFKIHRSWTEAKRCSSSKWVYIYLWACLRYMICVFLWAASYSRNYRPKGLVLWGSSRHLSFSKNPIKIVMFSVFKQFYYFMIWGTILFCVHTVLYIGWGQLSVAPVFDLPRLNMNKHYILGDPLLLSVVYVSFVTLIFL